MFVLLSDISKNKVLEFITDYNNVNDNEKLFNDYDITSQIKDKFFSVFTDKNYPLIQIVTEENFDDILKLSKEMRNNIRGQDIGGLG
jgi:energy-converting hydrogenase A subunit R